MDTIQINILNPKALQLLQDLVDLELISIKDAPANGFATALKKLRSKAESAPTLDEITREVESVRANQKDNHF
jgi:hypothetical protein